MADLGAEVVGGGFALAVAGYAAGTGQGGVRKKIKDITSKFFLMDNLVD